MVRRATRIERSVPEDRCWLTIGVWGRELPRCPELARVVHCRNCDIYRDAGRRMFDLPVPDGHGADWLGEAAAALATPVGRREAAIVFRVAGELLALPLSAVIEVLDWRTVRTVPDRRDDLLLGLVNVRGVLQLCVALEVLFGSPRPGGRARPPRGRMLAIGSSGAIEWIVPVEETLGLPDVPLDELQEVPVTLFRSQAAYVSGLFDYRAQKVGYLDAELVLGALRRRFA